ncbi:uncharacterized protein LOC129237930 isoform X1 [Anastrepha obliqua]|uniref:uncharacterized protein LOC129237930 isoform X1 n=1 Tax=Anastrepha obliqua TaxID=95512 RepID=UPI0024098312|nr:uncharacterized protein LOC129237930 isoform X1 [Anastrepha obliqua]
MSSSRNKFFGGGKLSNKSSGSSGLRILWIPGRHKSHPKGRFDSTNKQVLHKSAQKNSEVWSLGGSKNQRDLIESDPDSNLFDGPSVSGVTSAACAIGAVGAEKCATATTTPAISISADEANKIAAEANSYDAANTPSTASTTPLVSVPNSPDTGVASKVIVTTTTNTTESKNGTEVSMPAKTTSTIVTTTTTAEIMDENRFSILGKDISNEFNVYDLPSPPKNGFNAPTPEGATNALLNASAGTTASTATTPAHSNTSTQQNERDSITGSPIKKKKHHKNENNNHQNDINSIESISDNAKISSNDLDELTLERNGKDLLNKKKKKKKKKISTTKELDQLDGVSGKHNTKDDDFSDEDEKVVKCLYYTLMCCECTIS